MALSFYNYDGNLDAFRLALRDCIILFLVSIAVSIVASIVIAGLAMHFIHQAQTTTSVAVVAKIAESGNPTLHLAALFINNALMCALMIAIPYTIQRKWGKYLIFGAIISLGFLTGAVMLVVTAQHGVLFMLSSLVPHGLFELAAFFICTAFGIMVMRQNNFPTTHTFKEIWNGAIKDLMIIVIPLIVCAAIIETYITPILMSLVG